MNAHEWTSNWRCEGAATAALCNLNIVVIIRQSSSLHALLLRHVLRLHE